MASDLNDGFDAGPISDADPSPGSRVSLIPTEQPAPALAATLHSWLASPGGLAITADVRVDRAALDLLAGASVWATFRTDDGGQLVVAALARPSSGSDELLELTGVAMLARELRRETVRAALRHEVRLLTGDDEHPATTLDLSSGGCRVQVAEPGAFDVGNVVDVELDLAGAGPVTASGQVVRSDPVAHEVAVRFIDLTESAEAALDALVYRTITPGAAR
ncbi:MAG TPA: PilZ domain-containing protein [Frankiaceae bacterium]|nr:PilZ domain-containing protein [Frankiaceae bacterium]